MTNSNSIRFCRCGTRLARDNPDTRCGLCQRQQPRGQPRHPPEVPADFWQTDEMLQALGSQDVGRICAAYRQHPFHGSDPLTQKVLAGWLGIDQAYLSRIETGQRQLRNLDMLVHWAKTLGIPPRCLWFDLPGQPRNTPQPVADQPGDSETTCLGAAVQAIRHALLRCGDAPNDDGAEPPTLTTLRRELDRAYRLRQASRYNVLGQVLPRLLAQAQRLTLSHVGDDRRHAYVLLADVNHLAVALLKKAGARELAWVAIDRSRTTAELAGAPLLEAVSAYRLSNLLLSAGHLAEARDIAARALDRLDTELGMASAEHLSMWGALCLKSAVIAARQGDRVTASQLLTEAKAAADRLGEDRNDFWTAFGPTNVAIHEVSVAVELGDAGEAIRRAGSVDSSRLPAALRERRSRFLIDLAYAYVQRRQDLAALRALLRAERAAPEEVRFNRRARGLLRELLGRERQTATPQLRTLAARAGVL